MNKKSEKWLIVVAIFVLSFLSWYSLINTAQKKEKQYEAYLSSARERKSRDYFDDAIDNYNAALAMSDSLELRNEIADYYLEKEYVDIYLDMCEEMTTKYPRNPLGYEKMAAYYKEKSEYSLCFQTLNNAQNRKVSSEKLDSIRSEIRYEYEYVVLGYEQIRTFSFGICATKIYDGKWGYVGTNGGCLLPFKYDDVTDYNGEYMTVKEVDEKYYIIEKSGRHKSDDVENKKIETVGYLSSGKMAIKYDGKYHYCDFNFKPVFGSFDYAGAFNCGVAAVKNGEKWQIIKENGELIKDKFFDEIKVDEKGIAFYNNVAFAKRDGVYIMINTSGNRVGSLSWSDAITFASEQPTSVFNGKKWGFVDVNGEMVADYKFEKALPFSNGLAAVLKDEKWGYIGIEDFEIKINPDFSDATTFNDSGRAFVKKENGWDLIKLYSFN